MKERIIVSNREELDAVDYDFSGELVICFDADKITDELQKFTKAKIVIPQ